MADNADDADDDDAPTFSLRWFAAEFAAAEAYRLTIRTLRRQRSQLLTLLTHAPHDVRTQYFKVVLRVCEIARWFDGEGRGMSSRA